MYRKVTTPYSDKRQKLLDLHKVLMDSIAATEKDINQCSLEWLQLCNINKTQESESKLTVGESNKQSACASSPSKKVYNIDMEDSKAINTQPIDLHVVNLATIKVLDEEFDSE